MSSVPGGSGENVLYAVLCGGVFAGALAYVSPFRINNKKLEFLCIAEGA